MTTKERTIRLRGMLEQYRGRLLGEIAGRMCHIRDESPALQASDVLDRVERIREEDIDYALLGMKTETVRRVDHALQRVDTGAYGQCAECGQDISDERLLALPFAIRCRDCEEGTEAIRGWQAPPRSPVLFVFDERYA